MRARNSPRPSNGRQNLSGKLIRRLRKEAGLSQEELAAKLQLAGWDADQFLVTSVEIGNRTLVDYELKFLLDFFGKTHHDIEWE